MPSPAAPTPHGGRGARARILETAARLFAEQGINRVGVADLAAAAPVSKRTLYQHFSSKEALVVAHLDACAADPAAPEAALWREDLTPRAQLLELFTALGERPPHGDPFGRAAAEFPDPTELVHRRVEEHARAFAARLAELARSAGARDPETTARRLALLYEGAAARTLVDGTPQAAADAYAMAARILQDAIDLR